ncbi:MAG: aldehyde dehydrogenase family protein [Pseudomonadota bacterium]
MTEQATEQALAPALHRVPAPAIAPYHGKLLIDGIWREAKNGLRLERSSPAHGVTVATYAAAGTDDVALAVQAAHAAFRHSAWAAAKGVERAALLLKVADGIDARLEQLALQEALESGKPLTQARSEMAGCAGLWRYAAALARTLSGDSYNTLGEDMLGVVLRQPVGVVAMVTPWNFPLWILCQKLPFALAAGCTAVVKPSELTSGTTLMLGEILLDAGLPAGVVNIVTGLGGEAGQPLVEHEQVDMVSFTGSTRVGREIGAIAGRQLKKVALELGGKNPQIIFPDCDWEAAVDAVVFGVYFNAGECCNSGSRVLVHESIAERFTQAVVERARQVPVGDPLHPEVKVGAMVSPQQLDGVLASIASAREAGAKVVLGGARFAGADGCFLQPTVLTGVRPEMAIAREEVFGPVLAVLTFRDLDHAVELANGTLYGLSAAIWSRDIDTCLAAARRIDAGTVWVNTFLDGYPELPFGGFGDSGVGRELGRHAVEDYTETKSVQLHMGPRTGWWLPRA